MKKIMMFVPGLRSNVVWIKLLASIYYLFSILMMFSNLSTGLFLLALPFLFFYLVNFINYKKRGLKFSRALVPVIISSVLVILSIEIASPVPQNKIIGNNKSNEVERQYSIAGKPTSAPNKEKTTSDKNIVGEKNTSNGKTPEKNATQTQSPLKLQKAKVTKIVDGDTVYVKFENGQEKKVRLIGVDTPETKHPEKGVQHYGKEASNYTQSKLYNKSIYLDKDVSDTDKYGRLLRYVWIESPASAAEKEIKTKMFNAILVLNGYAKASTYPPDVKYSQYFVSFQEEARNAERGLWGKQQNTQSGGSVETPKTAQPVTSKGTIKQISLSNTVRQGENASITIQGQPNVVYSITVTYKSGPSKARELDQKKSGSDGKVSWVWKVGTKTTPGRYPITIAGGGKTLTAYFNVTK